MARELIKIDAKSILVSLINSTFKDNGAAIEKLAFLGHQMYSWKSSALSYAGAQAVQSRLELLKVGQTVGKYTVKQKSQQDNPLYSKALEFIDDDGNRRQIELQSLEPQQLIELDQLCSQALSHSADDPKHKGAAQRIEELSQSLQSWRTWPLSLMCKFDKFIDGIKIYRPTINNKGQLTFERWNSVKRKVKIVQGCKIKGQSLAVQIDDTHWTKVQERLNLPLEQLVGLKEQALNLASSRNRPIGKPFRGATTKDYCPIPWKSDVLEILQQEGYLEGETFHLISYDLEIFLEQADWQLLQSKYKLDDETLALIEQTVAQFTLDRAVDAMTKSHRAYKEDLYRAVEICDLDPCKLLKKESLKYTAEEVEEKVEEETQLLTETLKVKEVELEQKSREIKEMKQEIQQLQEEMQEIRQFIASQKKA